MRHELRARPHQALTAQVVRAIERLWVIVDSRKLDRARPLAHVELQLAASQQALCVIGTVMPAARAWSWRSST
jgi:hypothetical protein